MVVADVGADAPAAVQGAAGKDDGAEEEDDEGDEAGETHGGLPSQRS